MRDKQYLAAIRPYGSGLALSTMLFADEVVDQSQLDAMPERKTRVSAREKEMATQIVDSMSRHWDPDRYHDDYEKQLRDIIKAKSKGKEIQAQEPERPAQVVDLMDALRASLEKPRPRKRAGSHAKRGGRKPTKRASRGARAERTA